MNPDAAMSFFNFVEERHAVWVHRQTGDPQPWTNDPIIGTKKFTNVFRVLDHGSQFLLNVLKKTLTKEDALFQSWLYRYTNLPDGWIRFAEHQGDWPAIDYLDEGYLEQVWTDHIRNGGQLFSGAYMINGGSSKRPGVPKHLALLELTEKEFLPMIPGFFEQESLKDRVAYLSKIPFCSSFMAQQICTDFGYWDPTFHENDYVALGPGALKGCREIDPETKPEATFAWFFEQVLSSDWCPSVQVDADTIRFLSKMDVQNCFCEFSKYARYDRKPSSSPTLFSPTHPTLEPVYPKHWSN
jgi:hypothetical protein